MNPRSSHIAFALLLIAHPLDAQHLIVRHQESMQSYSAGTRVADVVENGRVVASSSLSDDDVVRCIVDVAAAPASSAPHLLSKASQAAAAAVRGDVRQRLAAVSPSVTLHREFTHVVNGFAITARRKDLAAVKAIAGVRHLYDDVKVSALPIEASAPAVQTASPLAGIASGKGVKVGVIDTGIDYLHEALGQGFGGKNKVRGGFDFVNNDADPADDNGHGTHVAGIIAGESKTITGMASGAALYAYKALDASGEGYASTVIAALDRAVDDSMQVVNLSLGTASGDPDDILSQAVDRAAAAGLVVVAAAGNAAEYGSIGSPGAARGALTVGALDAKDAPASFSSKGPVLKNFGLKPEIAAPGVAVISAKKGGGYIAMTGTSMAAPYVSSLAAVLRELHPSWSAAQIRDALICSARPLPYAAFMVGSGRADPLRAVRLGSLASPAAMSLGFDTNTGAAWTARETLYVSNAAAYAQHYTLSVGGAAPGISVRFSDASVDVLPGGQAVIVADIIADNAQLADNSTVQEGYAATITAVSSTDTVRMRFAFFKGTMLRLQFDETPWQVVVHDRAARSFAFQPKTQSLAVVLPAGTYDVLSSFYPSRYVVREGLKASGIADAAISSAEAVHPVTLVPTDETGRTIDAGLPHEVFSSIEGMVHKASGIGVISMTGGPFTESRKGMPAWVSGVSAAYVFGAALNVQMGSSITYTFESAIDSGITGAAAMRFAPDELKRIEVRYEIDTAKSRTAFPVAWSFFRQKGSMTGSTYYDGAAEPLRAPFTQTSFYAKRSSPAFPIFHSREAYKY